MSARQTVLPLLVLTVLVLAFFWKLAFTDLILARGDTYNYFYPYWDARNDAFRAGEMPLWTPEIFMGAPLFANPQLGALYPPNWLTAPLSAPDAIKISLLLHLIWAGWGVVVLFRATVNDAGRVAPLLAGMLYALGGYLGAHVEQINQLQGLAWLPWLIWLYHRALQRGRSPTNPLMLLLGMALALQFFSGHTQTVFSAGVTLAVYGVFHGLRSDARRGRQTLSAILLLLDAALVALLLALPQLLPTLELTGFSNRGGGLNPQEATAFSLPPTYVGRALLPAYGGQLFGEYIATLGVMGLGLALLGALSRSSQRFVWGMLAVLGLALALGRFNPLYWLLAELPGFNLFRVPARWLSLFALGGAMLAGLGWRELLRARPSPRWLMGIVGALLLLMFLTRFILPIDPADVAGSAMPTNGALLLWLMALGVWAALVWWQRPAWLLVALGVELFLASQIMPYQDLAPRDVYEGQRFTISQLSAYAAESSPPGRTLAISGLLFDPGERDTLRARYEATQLMDAQAVRHALVAIKRQEMLKPNLPLTWGLPSVDGFGGGVLPTIYYSQFTSLLLPSDSPRTVDGRLGEMLARPECRGACVPPQRWLDLTQTRYLIVDKVYDVWHEGVAYDTALPFSEWPTLPDFRGDTVGVLLREGATVREIALSDWPPADLAPAEALAVSLIDRRTGDFVQLTPPGWTRALSSDVKIYANQSVMPRAFVVHDAIAMPTTWDGTESALRWLADERFNPRQSAIVHGAPPLRSRGNDPNASSATITRYEATQIDIRVNAERDGYLVLTDAWYPGWRATLNGAETEVYRANGMFRAVRVPPGESVVSLRFAPTLWYASWAAGALLWGGLLLVLGWRVWRASRRDELV